MKSLTTSYLFWIPSLFGIAGLHRIYMGKVGTGILYLMTGGLFGIGTIYDAITMPVQIAEVNRDEYYRRGLHDGGNYQRVVITETFGSFGNAFQSTNQGPPAQGTIEQVIFRLAQKNGGSVSPAQLALDSNIGVDEAKNQLESMVDRGYAELRVRKTGALAYVFPEFLNPDVSDQFESLT